jgi:hypothetical protein
MDPSPRASRVNAHADASPFEPIVDGAVEALRSLWVNDARFWGVFFALQALLLRNVFGAGMLADNDSMGHYGFLRYFTEEFWPQTHALFGFSERYNFGAPYLLYNVPPGLTWVGALLVAVGFTPAAALKTIAVLAYLSLGPLAAGLGKHLDARSTALPRFLALGMMLFSSELFGLEFFFRNGMLNAACAVPLLLLGLRVAAGIDPDAAAMGRRITCLAVVFAALILVHVLSAYYLAVGLLALALGLGRSGGRALLVAGLAVALGGALAAFWVLPSVPFAAREDAAYTWVRDTKGTVLAFLDGSLVTSYFAGFFPSFVRVSNVGLVVVSSAAVGVVEGFRRRDSAVRGFAIFFFVTFAVALGPSNPVGRLLPGFERLLWYRFLTPATLALIILAAYGAARVVAVGRWRATASTALLLAGSLAFVSVLQPAARVQTTASYNEFTSSYERVIGALRLAREPGDRVFSEFLGFDVRQPPSVNVLRHLVALDAGVEEIASWVYENNTTGRALLRSGPFWYDPVAIADSARDLGVRFVIAGSDALRFALDHDGRFEPMTADDSLALYRVRDPMARVTVRASAGPERAVVSVAHGREGGGYGYRIDLGNDVREGDVLVLRTNLEGWRVTADGVELEPRATQEGFLSVPLRPGVRRVEAHWSVPPSAGTGRLVSLCALVALVGLAVRGGAIAFPRRASLVRALDAFGLAIALAVALAALVRSSRVDFSRIAFGLANGLRVSPESGASLAFGTWHELQSEALVSGMRKGASYMLTTTVFPGAQLTFDADAPSVRVRPAGWPDGASVDVRPGEPFALPQGWVASASASTTKPARALELIVEPSGGVGLARVALDGGVRVLEAESFRNTTDDGGGDGFYGPSHPPYVPLGGNTVVMRASSRDPVHMVRTVDDLDGRYEVFVLLRSASMRDARARASIAVSFGDYPSELRGVDGADLPR